jgi:hypothetical protein
MLVEIHKAKEIVQLLNDHCQRLGCLKTTPELKQQLLEPIDEIKKLLQTATLKEAQ